MLVCQYKLSFKIKFRRSGLIVNKLYFFDNIYYNYWQFVTKNGYHMNIIVSHVFTHELWITWFEYVMIIWSKEHCYIWNSHHYKRQLEYNISNSTNIGSFWLLALFINNSNRCNFCNRFFYLKIDFPLHSRIHLCILH